MGEKEQRRNPSDPPATGLDDDPGGMPFDDDFDAGEPNDLGGRGGVPGAPAYDSGTILTSRGIGYPDSTPKGMTALKGYVISRWGGTDLGCLSKPPRKMLGGTSPSLHCWGIAWDWRWSNPGPGRATADEVIEFCLDNTGPLAIQAVHDYVNCRYWKSYSGWQDANNSASTGFGQSWAQWLHIERTWAAANDDRRIEQALADSGITDNGQPRPQPKDGAGKLELPDPVVKDGDVGANVALLQDFLRFFHFADFSRSDGEFGERTVKAVKNAQQTFAAKGWYDAEVDGEYGPRSHVAATRCRDEAS
ncbi:MAG: peptidoglycan-binding protein [Actinomycetota bacterium]|jgi:hypothetical protein|nr:peptidoglycan-binding protein [Actinomycetota bacterium]